MASEHATAPARHRGRIPLRRRSPAVRVGQGATALLAGVAGIAAGAGVATGHLAKAGLDAAAVAAAVVLVTSVIALFWGAATLVRAIPGWWRLVAVPVALVLLWFVLLPLTVAVNATTRPPGPRTPGTPRAWPPRPGPGKRR